MIVDNLPVLIPLSLLVGSLLTVVVGQFREKHAYSVTILAVGIAALLAVTGLVKVIQSGTVRYSMAGWPPPIGIEYVLDPLSAFMTVVVLLTGFIVLLHSQESVAAELSGRSVQYYAVALLLLLGFNGIILTGDLFNLYVFLEISALSGYALIAAGEKQAPVAAYRYLLIGTVGASFFLLGLGFVYIMTGSLNIIDLSVILPTIGVSPPIIVGLLLMVVGMAIKMALFPLHGWQPDAYTFSPSTTTALLAPIATKVAAYALIRVMFYTFEASVIVEVLPLAKALTWAALAAILFGSIMAIAQKELKRMLAYSSLAQIGYIGLGIGLANPVAFAGAVLHILNHAFMKGGLFLVVGNLRLKVGHSRIPAFNGSLQAAMPWTMAAFTVFALSMIGIPPLAGFFSKWYLVLGGLEANNWIAVSVILISSLLNGAYFFRVLENMYLKEAPTDDQSKNALPASLEVGRRMLIPTLIMAIALLAFGLLNVFIVNEIILLMTPRGL